MPSTRQPERGSGGSQRTPAQRTSATSRSAQERLAQQQADRRRQRVILAVIVGALVVVVVVAATIYRSWQDHREPTAPPAQPNFPAVSITNGRPILLGAADAGVTLGLYEDFRCPHCADFEEDLGPTITDLQRAGTAKVALYPMSFVDPEHGSVSSANAMACAAEAGRGQEYYAGLFANYPMEWTDQRLLRLGQLVGLDSAAFRGCVTGQAHRGWVDSISTVAADNKVEQTPTVFINDQLKTGAPDWTPDQLTAEVEAAQ